jgi:hypothetical protein
MAFRYKNVVIKTPTNYGYTFSIKDEHDAWKSIKKKNNPIVGLFNPILYYGKITDRNLFNHCYSMCGYVTPFRKYKGIKKHKSFKKYDNVIEYLLPDNHSGNIGVYNGLPMIIDYQQVEWWNTKLSVNKSLSKPLSKNWLEMKRIQKEVSV